MTFNTHFPLPGHRNVTDTISRETDNSVTIISGVPVVFLRFAANSQAGMSFAIYLFHSKTDLPTRVTKSKLEQLQGALYVPESLNKTTNFLTSYLRWQTDYTKTKKPRSLEWQKEKEYRHQCLTGKSLLLIKCTRYKNKLHKFEAALWHIDEAWTLSTIIDL